MKVQIDGKPISYNINPILLKDRTFVQFRPTFEDLGMKVDWNRDDQTVTAMKDGYQIELFLGKTDAYVNGVAYTLDAAPFVTNNYLMVPLRFISEATGRFVHWNAATQLISIVETDLSKFTDKLYTGNLSYVGDLKGDVRDGQGRLVYPNGRTFYEGGFVQGKLDGQGKYYDENGYLIYEGGWKLNLMDGSGKWYYGDGSLKYDGQYKAGKRDGTGTFHWRLSDGGEDYVAALPADVKANADQINTYTGSFANDKFEGQGSIAWADGSSYEGGFKDGMLHGSGVFVWADKWKYEGSFVNGARKGDGKLYDPDGNLIYEGQFKNNQYNGQGELFDASGKSLFKGTFVDGKPQSGT
jgi:hypothetical protein